MVSYIKDSIIVLGFSDQRLTDYNYYGRFNGQYPALFSTEETSESYENRYASMLKLLIDNPDFYRIVNPTYFQHGESIELLEEEYNRIKDNGLSIKGVRVYTSKQEAIELLQDDNALFTWINDAKFSVYQDN